MFHNDKFMLLSLLLLSLSTSLAEAVLVNTATLYAGTQCEGPRLTDNDLLVGEINACVHLQVNSQLLPLTFDCGNFNVYSPVQPGCTGPRLARGSVKDMCLVDVRSNTSSMTMQCANVTDAVRIDLRQGGGCDDIVTNSTLVRLGECTRAGASLYPADNFAIAFTHAYLVTKTESEYVVEYFSGANCTGNATVVFPPVALEACVSVELGSQQQQSVSVHEIVPAITPAPSTSPSTRPSALPSVLPTSLPTALPTTLPSNSPSTRPTALPTSAIPLVTSALPTTAPTLAPSPLPDTLGGAAPNPSSAGRPRLAASLVLLGLGIFM